MTSRYLLLRLDDASTRVHVSRVGMALRDFKAFIIEHDLIAFVCPTSRHLCLPGESGFIIGHLFDRHGSRGPLEALSDQSVHAIVQSNGRHLISSYWGGYVAAVRGQNSTSIIRDPSGALPCYYVETEGMTAFSGDIGTLIRSGLITPQVDWSSLSRHLFSGGLPSSSTALDGVAELLPGDAYRFSANHRSIDSVWSPWAHAILQCEEEAAEQSARIRRVVQNCVGAWASSFQRILLTVSGGLDSSVVAACLANRRGEVVSFTMFTDDPAGDERTYSRILCSALSIELIEKRYSVQDIDIRDSSGSHLPRPVGRTQSLAYENALVAALPERGADVFFTGNGGDNVFAYSQSATALLDRYLQEGFGLGSLHTLRDIQRLTGCSIGEALRAAFRTARAPTRSYTWKPDRKFLAHDLITECSRVPLKHPWLTAPEGVLPGQVAHISGLVRIQQNLVPRRSVVAPVINPLVSQPIIEECLRVPSWRWCHGGRNRSVAREAFSSELPSEILSRTAKGTPDGFCLQIVERYRGDIMERLLEGHLARHRLIDRDDIERSLKSDRLFLGTDHVRLLDLLDTEAWIDHWTAGVPRPPLADTACGKASSLS